MLDTWPVLKLKMKKPTMRDVFNKRVRCHAHREKNGTYYRVCRTAGKIENDQRVTRIERRSLIKFPSRNLRLFLLIYMERFLASRCSNHIFSDPSFFILSQFYS